MKKRLHIFLIIALLIIIAAIVAFAVYRINRWINPVVLENRITQEDIDNYEDNYDVIVPLTDESGYLIRQDVKTILILGNNPFYDNRDDKDSLAGILEKETGANVINCSIPGTYMSSKSTFSYPDDNPLGIYSPYYLTGLLLFKGELYDRFIEYGAALGVDKPENADSVVKTLYETDPADIDVIIYMYDLEDYYQDSIIYDPENEFKLYTACGNLNSAFTMISLSELPIRPIVMSPYYNSYMTADGKSESIEFHPNSFGRPSDYVLCMADTVTKSCFVSFVDNYFGTVTEDNYPEYLIDDRHLNTKGREFIISRLLSVLYHYN